MRLTVATLLLALAACGPESQPRKQAGPAGPAAAAQLPASAAASSAQVMAIPDDPDVLKRLEAMGYTVHADQGHLHPPGMAGCPAMGDGAAM